MYNKNKLIDKEKNKIFETIDYIGEDVSILTIEKRSLITMSGLVFNNNGLVKKSIYSYPISYMKFFLFSVLSIFKRNIKRINEPVGIIHTSWTLGYYHWLTESIPRLIYLKNKHPTVNVYLPIDFKRYEIYFDMLGFEKPIYYSNSSITTDKVYLPICPRKMAILNKNAYSLTRNSLRDVINFDNSINRKIYISRKSARGRKVINEAEVESVLINNGYEIYDFDKLSIVEQQKLCSESKCMISIHGAALTNMMFMPKGSEIIELIPKKRNFFREFNFVRSTSKHDPCFYRLANALEHNYHYLECISIDNGQRMSHMDDIVVDVNKLIYLLKSY